MKKFLSVVATIALIGGPVLAGVTLLIGVINIFTPRSGGLGFMLIVPALYLLFAGLLIGGVLRLLVSIDNRLERLEARN
ncbi:MAG: hypothetical protein ACT6RD_13850 [Brevundimonas sp.]|uniref:hypothetical protein n=1 Tax=Brevundimonas sp. TaxID=1871086 RepID=UPI0040347C4E